MAKRSADYGVMENVAAIAMNIGASKKRDAAYAAAADSMGGFPGFYQAAVEMGVSLEQYATARKIAWGDHADWILTTENVSEALLNFLIRQARLPDESDRASIIKKNITS